MMNSGGVICARENCPSTIVIGFDRCWFHLTRLERGRSGRVKAKMEVVRITELAGRIDTSPAVAMLNMVQEAASNVAFYGQQVAALRAELEDQEDGAPVIIDAEGVARVHPAWVGAGVAGRVDPANWKTEPHVLVRMYNDERDRLVRYAKLCLDAGVAERLVKLAERQGTAMVQILDAALERLELTPEQIQRLPAVMAEVLGPAPLEGQEVAE